MPPSTRAPLKVCDEVDVLAIDAFNILWVKENYPQTWHRERIAGVVSDKVGDKWCVSFPDGEVKHLSRPKIKFLKRPPATHHEGEPVIEEDSSSERESGAEEPAADSSDNDGEPSFFNEEADHDNYPEKSGKKSDTLDISDRWQQEELFNFDQRAKFGYYEQYGPHINAGLADNHDKPFYTKFSLSLASTFCRSSTSWVWRRRWRWQVQHCTRRMYQGTLGGLSRSTTSFSGSESGSTTLPSLKLVTVMDTGLNLLVGMGQGTSSSDGWR